MAERKSYTREAVRERTGGGGIKVAGAEDAQARGDAAAVRFGQAVAAGYDPAQYGYNPETAQRVGQTAATRQSAESRAAQRKQEIEQEEADKRAMMNEGLTADGKTRAPKPQQRAVTSAPRKSFEVGEDGAPTWTGGYIDGRVGGEVMKEMRIKAEEDFKQGKGPEPYGPSKSEREYDAYLAAKKKYDDAQKPAAPAAPADPTTALDGVDESATPSPTTAPPSTTATPVTAAPITPKGDSMSNMDGESPAAVAPADRSPTGDAARFFNTVAKGVSAGGSAGSFNLRRPAYNAPQTGLAGVANKYLSGQAKAGQFLQTNLDDAIKNTAGLTRDAGIIKTYVPTAQKLSNEATAAYNAAMGKGTGNLLKLGNKARIAETVLQKTIADAQAADDLVKGSIGAEATAAKAAAEFAKKSNSVVGKAASKTATAISNVAKSRVATGLGKGATALGAGMDVFDSIGAVGSVYGDNYDSNTAEAAAYRKRLEEAQAGGAGGAAKFIASQTYNLTPAVLGGGGNTVSGVKDIIDTQSNLQNETIAAEGEVGMNKMRMASAERKSAQREPYVAALLPAADPNLPENERRAAQKRAFAKLPKEDRSRILEQAEVNMTVDKMLTRDPALKQFIESDPERGAEMMNEMRTQATEQRRLFKEKQKNTGRP